MPNFIRKIAVLLVALAALVSLPARGGQVEDFLANAPDLKGIADELRVLNMQGRSWSAKGKLFGMEATIHLYWPAGAQPGQHKPVVVVPLPDVLTVGSLLAALHVPESVYKPIDMGFDTPVLFWLPPEHTLLRSQEMPSQVQSAVRNLSFPGQFQAQPGVNLFGKIAASQGSLLQGLTGLVNFNPNNWTAAFAKSKEGAYVTSLWLKSRWSNPFHLGDTEMNGGLMRITRKGADSKIEAWGNATIKRQKEFTVYLMNDTKNAVTEQGFGFDLASASLNDFFLLSGVVSKTLGLPVLPMSRLPLDKVKISNPQFRHYSDPNSLPVFENMLFQGTKKGPAVGELHVHGKATVFGWSMAQGNIDYTRAGIMGDVELNPGRIGPIESPSARFYLTLNNDEQNMGIKAKTPLDNDPLDLRATATSLQLSLPPSCPLRPVGLKADIGDVNGDFPITPLFDDCIGKGIQDLIEGGEAAFKEVEHVARDLANDGIAVADELGHDAANEFQKLHLERAAAWTGALASHAAEVKTVQDAERAAVNAVKVAENAVNALGKTISRLDEEIKDLTNEIKDLLNDIWDAVTGKVKSKKKEKARKVTERDHARTEKAAAKARLERAQEVKANLNTDVPSPYIAGQAAELQEKLAAAQAQALVQPQVAESLKILSGQLGDRKKRQALFAAIDHKAVVEARKIAFAKDYPTMSAFLGRDGGKSVGTQWLADTKKSLVSEAIGAQVSAETERVLRQTVPTLPTMAHNMPVSVILAGGQPLCMQWGSQDGLVLAPCNGSPEQQMQFRTSGALLTNRHTEKVKAGNSNISMTFCVYVDLPENSVTALTRSPYKCNVDAAHMPQLFFFDPADGLIRYLPPKATAPLCLRAGPDRKVIGGECPQQGQEALAAQWRLADPKDAVKARQITVSSGSLLKGGMRAGVPAEARTNLKPLVLE